MRGQLFFERREGASVAGEEIPTPDKASLHQRHKPPQLLSQPRELVIVCGPMRSNVNLSRIVRVCGCCGITKIFCVGTGRVIEKIARDGTAQVEITSRRSLLPLIENLRREKYHLVGLEQAATSKSLHTYQFRRRTALIVGNERSGIPETALARVDDIVEIPVYGLPFSHNAATAAAIAMYEYCRQFPNG